MFNEGFSRGPRICRDSSHGVKEIVVNAVERIFPPRRTVGFSISREFSERKRRLLCIKWVIRDYFVPSSLSPNVLIN